MFDKAVTLLLTHTTTASIGHGGAKEPTGALPHVYLIGKALSFKNSPVGLMPQCQRRLPGLSRREPGSYIAGAGDGKPLF